jgi:peptidoglycan hydrolase FlgJ
MDEFSGIPLSAALMPPANRALASRLEAGGVNDEIRRVAEEFESVFLTEMLAPMFEGVETDGLGGGGDGEKMFRPMLIERYAQAIAKAGGIGLADSVMSELARLQTTIPEADDGADR